MLWSFKMASAHILQGEEDPWNSCSPNKKVEGKTKKSKWEHEKFGPSPFMEYLPLFLIVETLQSCIFFRFTQMARKDFVGITLPVPQVP